MLAVAVAAVLALAPMQDPAPVAPAAVPAGEALRVFLDCNYCDMNFMRTEIRFVNYVRDRTDAQVHILVTQQTTGGGGDEFTLNFIGLREFAGRNDTLRYVALATATADETRNGLARIIRLGLVRYVAGSPMASRLDVRYTAPAGDSAAAPRPRDPWNNWVFRLSVNTFLNGEKCCRYRQLSGNVSANRVTDRWKIELEAYGNNNRNSFAIDDTTTFVSERESYGTEAGVVRSLGPHWSVGANLEARQESFRNIDLRIRGIAALEYSVFPYSQSTRRLLLIRYGFGPEFSNYRDTTIYGRVSERRMKQVLEAEYSVTQPWGNVSVESSFSQYLHDRTKLNIQTYGDLSIRIVRGLDFNIFGGYEVIRDQLYLPAEGATPEEIIAQQRQLATGYYYYTGVGLSYRFGSIFNNVVNPRFGN